MNGGDDCIVSFDDFSNPFQTVRSGVETLMHEFGHNLNQRHGGETHFTANPAYNSVMSYNWQLRTGRSNNARNTTPVCVPFYYHDAGATEPNGALPAVVNNVDDYSDGMNRDLTRLKDSIQQERLKATASGVQQLAVNGTAQDYAANAYKLLEG